MKKSLTESDLWKAIDEAMTSYGWDASRHEDRMKPGTPDVSYGLRSVNGWIELKSYDRQPKHDDDIPQFRDFKPLQRRFLRKRYATGGNCWILASFGTDILLFSAEHVDQLGHSPWWLLVSMARVRWNHTELPANELNVALGTPTGGLRALSELRRGTGGSNFGRPQRVPRGWNFS